MSFDITKVPMVRVTWHDARDMETGWLPIKDILNAPLAIPSNWIQKIEYLGVEYAKRNDDSQSIW